MIPGSPWLAPRCWSNLSSPTTKSESLTKKSLASSWASSLVANTRAAAVTATATGSTTRRLPASPATARSTLRTLPGRRSFPVSRRASSRMNTRGTKIPRIMKEDATAMAAAIPNPIIDSMPDTALDRKAAPSVSMASARAPATPANPTLNAGPAPSPFRLSSR